MGEQPERSEQNKFYMEQMGTIIQKAGGDYGTLKPPSIPKIARKNGN